MKLNVMLELTRKCNLKCKHCYNNSSPESKIELTISEIEQLIIDLKEIEKNYPIERITLTGGEFTLMSNSLEIYKKIKENFNAIIRIETNGFLYMQSPELFSRFDNEEFFISIDRLHGSIKEDGSSELLNSFIKYNEKSKKIIARITITKGDEELKNKFIKKYSSVKNLLIEAKYVSPSGRAKENYIDFQGYKLNENPELFKCLANNSILFNTDKKWYACYTACPISYVGDLGDQKIGIKMKLKRESKELKILQEKGIVGILDNFKQELIKDKKFYYRCEPCIYLQKLINNKKIILLDLPAVDTTQDIYTKGFIFPTFTEKYLLKLLEMSNLEVEYYNLNKEKIQKIVNYINKEKCPIYIHLTANKYYSYSVFKKLINDDISILIGGPLPKFEKEIFDKEIIIDDELEETGILNYFGIKNSEENWESPNFKPLICKNNFKNESVEKDFSNIVLFGRGCFYNCSFCIHSNFHKKFHIRNIESIRNELNTFSNEKTSIYIADASVGNLKYYRDILLLLQKYKNISFSMNVRADQINEEFIKIIKKINVQKLYIGLESPDEEKLKFYNKGEKVTDINSAIDLLKENSINYHLSLILSSDFNLKKAEEITEKFNAETYSFHFYIPYPGTYGYTDKWFVNRNWPKLIENRVENHKQIKKDISKLLSYPLNEYHTITPHCHLETFKIINKKLDELEECVRK